MITQIILFLLTFLFVFMIYEMFLVRKSKKDKRRKKIVEVQYLENRFHLDISKLNYKRLLNVISLISALDISIVVTVISLIDSLYLQLAIGFVMIFGVIIISYTIVGKIYEKKGCCKK